MEALMPSSINCYNFKSNLSMYIRLNEYLYFDTAIPFLGILNLTILQQKGLKGNMLKTLY